MFPSLSTSYIVEIKKKPNTVVLLKYSLANALVVEYVLMEQAHDWLVSFALKNEPVYPLHQQIQQFLTNSRI